MRVAIIGQSLFGQEVCALHYYFFFFFFLVIVARTPFVKSKYVVHLFANHTHSFVHCVEKLRALFWLPSHN